MDKVLLKKPWGGHPAGEEIECDAQRAKQLKADGISYPTLYLRGKKKVSHG